MKKNLIGSVLAALGAGLLIVSCGPAKVAPDELSLEARAKAIHSRILTVDTHCDTPTNMLRANFDIGLRHEPGGPGSGLIDLPRMKEGGLDALFFGVYTAQGPLTADGYAKARARATAMLDAIDKMCATYPNLIGPARTPTDAYRLKKEGKLVAFIGMENGYPIGKDLGVLAEFARRGVRYLTLCHSADNDICTSSSTKRTGEDPGLLDFGRQVVADCNRLGVMVDVSHMSDKSFYDVLKTTKAQVIASHSCCRALCDNPRNLTDDMIRALAKNGGVLQMCFVSGYLKPPKPNPERDRAIAELEKKYGSRRGVQGIQDQALRAEAQKAFQDAMQKYPDERATVKDVVDHIDHIISVVGEDTAGIGTDFDGGGGVADCSDASKMYCVTMEMLRRGYSEARIQKIWGGNIMRVLQKVIDVSASAPGGPD
jgi:membrane dipeptidase